LRYPAEQKRLTNWHGRNALIGCAPPIGTYNAEKNVADILARDDLESLRL
jgi:hypothetical protein